MGTSIFNGLPGNLPGKSVNKKKKKTGRDRLADRQKQEISKKNKPLDNYPKAKTSSGSSNSTATSNPARIKPNFNSNKTENKIGRNKLSQRQKEKVSLAAKNKAFNSISKKSNISIAPNSPLASKKRITPNFHIDSDPFKKANVSFDVMKKGLSQSYEAKKSKRISELENQNLAMMNTLSSPAINNGNKKNDAKLSAIKQYGKEEEKGKRAYADKKNAESLIISPAIAATEKARNITSAVDWGTAKLNGGKHINAVSKLKDNLSDATYDYNKKLNASIDGDKSRQVVSNIAKMGTGLALDATLLPFSKVKYAQTAGKKIIPKLWEAIKTSSENVAKSPITYSRFAEMFGSRYDEALAEGATEHEAAVSGATYALGSTLLERTGGADKIMNQALAKKLGGSLIENVIKAAGTEALEEGAQNVFGQATKLNYKEIPNMVSFEKDKDAIVNIPNMLSDMGYGALLGGVGGGIIGGTVNSPINGNNMANPTPNISNNDIVKPIPKIITDLKNGKKVSTEDSANLLPSEANTAKRQEFTQGTGVTLPNTKKGTKKTLQAYSERNKNKTFTPKIENSTLSFDNGNKPSEIISQDIENNIFTEHGIEDIKLEKSDNIFDGTVNDTIKQNHGNISSFDLESQTQTKPITQQNTQIPAKNTKNTTGATKTKPNTERRINAFNQAEKDLLVKMEVGKIKANKDRRIKELKATRRATSQKRNIEQAKRIKNIQGFYKAKEQRQKTREIDIASRKKLHSEINRFLTRNLPWQIKNEIKRTFEDVNVNSLPARNFGGINIGTIKPYDVEQLNNIFDNLENRIEANEKNNNGIPEIGKIYRDCLLDIDVFLDSYRAEPLLKFDTEKGEYIRISDTNQQKNDVNTISTLTPTKKKTKDINIAQEIKRTFQRKFINAGEAIKRISKITGDESIWTYYDSAKRCGSISDFMIINYVADLNDGHKIYSGLSEVLEPVMKKGEEYYIKFNDYLLHKHNIDRYAYGTAIWGEEITADDSMKIIDSYLETNPEFKDYADSVYGYYQALMELRVQSGLVTKKSADYFQKKYPHYISTYRDTTNQGSVIRFENGAAVQSGIRNAKGGGDSNILLLHEQMELMTRSTVKNARMNMFANKLAPHMIAKDGHVQGAKKVNISNAEYNIDEEIKNHSKTSKGNFYLSFYKDGKKYEVLLEKDVAEGVNDLLPQDYQNDPILKIVGSLNQGWKDLITTYNPFFTYRNIVKDIQDSVVYSKNTPEWIKNVPKAINEILNDGPTFQRYKALGGFSTSFFNSDAETGLMKKHSLPRRVTLDKIEQANYLVEQAPRFCEFISTLEVMQKKNGVVNKINPSRKYKTPFAGLTNEQIQEALYNSADVTVNFKSRGSWMRFINLYLSLYSNPAMQGFSRCIRLLTDVKVSKRNKAKAIGAYSFNFAKLIVKLSIVGLPTIINDLLYGDDEEYKGISQSDKDKYYLIKNSSIPAYKGNNPNDFFKIPKGRLISFTSGIITRVLFNKEEMTPKDIAQLFTETIAPQNPIDNNIFSVGVAIFGNKMWNGRDIDSKYEVENVKPKDRYDEYTTSIAIWLGNKLNLSPKRIDYFINQVSGILGDVIMPLMTNASEAGIVRNNFFLDSTKKKYVSEFYDNKTEANMNANNNKNDYNDVVNRYMNKQAKKLSDYSQEISAIQNDKSLSRKEKQEKVKKLTNKKNDLAKKTIENQDAYEKAAKAYVKKYGNLDIAYMLTNKKIFGSKYALASEGKNLFLKAEKVHGHGVSYNDFFTVYADYNIIKSKNSKADLGTKKLLTLQKLNANSVINGNNKMAIMNELSIINDSTYEKAFKLRNESGISSDDFLPIFTDLMYISNDNKSAMEKSNIQEWEVKNYQIAALMDFQTIDDIQKVEYANTFDLISDSSTKDIMKFNNENGVDVKTAINFVLNSSKIKSDIDENGKSIKDSKENKIIGLVDSFNITNDQKTALYYSKYPQKANSVPSWGSGKYTYPTNEITYTGENKYSSLSIKQNATKKKPSKKDDKASTTFTGGSVDNGKFPGEIIDAAIKTQIEDGTPAAITLAQWAQESGYGAHTPKNSNNVFGIKAGKSWKGATVAGNNSAGNDPAIYRVYDNIEDGFKDHAKVLKNKYYNTENLDVADTQGWINALQGKYATDKNYGKALKKIVDTYGLDQYTEQAKGYKGSSAKKTYAPVDVGKINKHYPFGAPKSNNRGGTHKGTDFSVPSGTPVTAVGDGTVIKAGSNGSAYGNSVVVDMGNGYYYSYNHLNEWGVKKGDKVKAGDVVAKSGNTGYTSGAHLEIEVYKGDTHYGNQIDPVAYFGWGEAKQGTVISSTDTSGYSVKGGGSGGSGGGKSKGKSGSKRKETKSPVSITKAKITPRGVKNTGSIKFDVSHGTSIKSIDTGTVVSSGNNSVVIQTKSGNRVAYNNISQFIAKVGDEIAEGQEIAKSGKNGKNVSANLEVAYYVGGSGKFTRDDILKYYTFI